MDDRLAHGATDFGHSFEKSLPVRTIYFERLPNSLKLGFAAFVILIVIEEPVLTQMSPGHTVACHLY